MPLTVIEVAEMQQHAIGRKLRPASKTIREDNPSHPSGVVQPRIGPGVSEYLAQVDFYTERPVGR